MVYPQDGLSSSMQALMQEHPAKLHLLPPEILHRVAAFLPCSSILSLCFSNKCLYWACYDKSVFRRSAIQAIYEERYTHLLACDPYHPWQGSELDLASMSSRTTTELASDDEWYPEPNDEILEEDDWDFNDWGPPAVEPRRFEQEQWLSNWPGSIVFKGLSAGDSARIACAVEKAQQLFNVSLEHQAWDLSHQWTEGRWIDWLPHLMALGHASSLCLKPWNLQSLLFDPSCRWAEEDQHGLRLPEWNPCAQEYTTVGFCILTLILVWIETEPNHQEHLHTRLHYYLDDQFCLPKPTEYSVMEQIGHLLTDSLDIREYNLDNKYSVILRMIFHIKHANWSSGILPIPSVHRLPLSDTLGSLVPFRSSPDVFGKSKLTGSQLERYLTGEWEGWCRNRRGWGGHEIPPPFKGIQFTVKEWHPPYSLDIAALVGSTTGSDGWGSFTVEGTVSVEGEVWLTLRYEEDQSDDEIWRYRGSVTPFGISGVLEQDRKKYGGFTGRLRYSQGYFWLWKREWCYD